MFSNSCNYFLYCLFQLMSARNGGGIFKTHTQKRKSGKQDQQLHQPVKRGKDGHLKKICHFFSLLKNIESEWISVVITSDAKNHFFKS